MVGRVTAIADTSGILALLDRDDRHHQAAVEIVQKMTLVVPATVLPEVNYLATKYLGERVANAFLKDLTEGYFNYLSVDLDDIKRALEIINSYQDSLGLVDSSLVALAERYRIRSILTLDRRVFTLIKPRKIDYLELLP